MLKASGIIIVLVCSVFYGRSLSYKADEAVAVIDSLINLVKYIKTSIKTERLPLGAIYGSFNEPKLEEIYFMKHLRAFDFDEAITALNDIISDEAIKIIRHMIDRLGGDDSNSQIEICNYVESELTREAENLRKNLSERKQMYRLLPVLTGLSAIIVFI